MKAIKPIPAGAEIFNDYGNLPRSDLLRRYGYVADSYRQFDVVEISLDLITNVSKSQGLTQDKIEKAVCEYAHSHSQSILIPLVVSNR